MEPGRVAAHCLQSGSLATTLSHPPTMPPLLRLAAVLGHALVQQEQFRLGEAVHLALAEI